MGSSPTSGNYARSRKASVPKVGTNPAWAHKMRTERCELPTFCSGVRRATVAPYPRLAKRHYDLIFGRPVANQESFAAAYDRKLSAASAMAFFFASL